MCKVPRSVHVAAKKAALDENMPLRDFVTRALKRSIRRAARERGEG